METKRLAEDYKVVMITFESYHVKKVGGLAEVPPRLAMALHDAGKHVEVYTPAHGATDACRDPLYVIDGFCVSTLKGVEPTHYVVGGRLLDHPVVYPPDALFDKAVDFAKVLSKLHGEHQEVLSTRTIYHGHDWHSIPALLALNALATRLGREDRFVYHVHLLSKMRLPEDKLCRDLGLCEDTPIRGVDGVKPFRYYYDQSGGMAERLAALVVDTVVTVSKGYVKSVERHMGPRSWGRVAVVSNAAPLTWTEVRDILVQRAGVEKPEDPSLRLLFRRQLLTERLSRVTLSWTTSRVEQAVKKALEFYGVDYSEPFRADGPLIFAIGRLTKQKGFDVLFRALDKLLYYNPKVRVVVAALPVDENAEQVIKLAELMALYRENLRILPGALSKDFAVMFYYAANATVVPSRSEPFGLVALESMASGTPVVASRVDGLVDVVVDVKESGPGGTGVLFEPVNPSDLAEKAAFLAELTESGYIGRKEGVLIRRSCIERASEFNWRTSATQAIDVYTRVLMA